MSPFRKAAAATLAAVALIAGQAFSATVIETYSTAAHSQFFDNGAEGWYWYHDPIPEPEKKEEEKPELPPLPPMAAQPSKPAHPPFTLSWVKAMLPKYMETAWNNPTAENVEAYFLLQRFVLDRATNFADMAQRVAVGNRALDETMRRPLSWGGTHAANTVATARTDDLILNKIGEHAGLWFFFKSDCRYCEAQARVIGYLEDKGFPVLAVSIDGGELKTRKFQNTFVDQGHAEQLGVTATPTLFLMSEDGKFDMLGNSVIAMDPLMHRIILVGVRNGWITEEEYKETLPIMNPNNQRDLSKELPKLLEAAANPTLMFGSKETSDKLANLASSSQATSSIVQPENGNFIPPADLIKLVSGRPHGQLPGDKETIQEFINGNQPY